MIISKDAKPCPFCNTDRPRGTIGGKNWSGRRIICTACGAESLYNHWNQRPIEDALHKRIAFFENWTPTAENYNDLPESLRCYLHDLETNCDPAGMIAENVLARQLLAGQEKRIEELEVLLREVYQASSNWDQVSSDLYRRIGEALEVKQ